MGKNNLRKNFTRILVTGASGFIESHLCEGLLKKVYNVLGLTRLPISIKEQ